MAAGCSLFVPIGAPFCTVIVGEGVIAYCILSTTEAPDASVNHEAIRVSVCVLGTNMELTSSTPAGVALCSSWTRRTIDVRLVYVAPSQIAIHRVRCTICGAIRN